jgi:peptide deformylase
MTEAIELPQTAVPAILIVPDKRLRVKARKVGVEDRATAARLAETMLAVMYKAPGIGLAAPQIGVALRVVVIDLAPEGEPAPIVMINPEITRISRQKISREEGCLSLPGQYAEVARPEEVVVAFEDAVGKRQVVEADGLLAACIQHEIDHLDGILFVDYLSALKRNIVLRKLAKEQRDKLSTSKPAR